MIHADELEKLESLLQSKSYDALTSEEKIWVGQWIASEGVYNNLRKAEGEIQSYFKGASSLTPAPETLLHLKAQLHARQSSLPLHWWQVATPRWSAILLTITFGIAGWWIGSYQKKSDPIQASLPVIVRDTVYLAIKPDTVFVQQVIYRERSVLAKTVKQLEPLSSEAPARGINMKEKEELENLLVSGSM